MVEKEIRLIIVEDYKLLRIGLISLLNNDESITVLGEAGTGEHGLELIKKTKPDLVIVDLGLPGMNGIELTHKIKDFDENIRVIILTSHENEEEVIAALGAGANAYCVKGVETQGFIDIVKSVYEGAAWLDPAIASVGLKLFKDNFKNPSKASQETLDYELSAQELKILERIVSGKNNSEIGQELSISVHTVKSHVSKILNKMTVNDRVQAAVKAVKSGIV